MYINQYKSYLTTVEEGSLKAVKKPKASALQRKWRNAAMKAEEEAAEEKKTKAERRTRSYEEKCGGASEEMKKWNETAARMLKWSIYYLKSNLYQ